MQDYLEPYRKDMHAIKADDIIGFFIGHDYY